MDKIKKWTKTDYLHTGRGNHLADHRKDRSSVLTTKAQWEAATEKTDREEPLRCF